MRFVSGLFVGIVLTLAVGAGIGLFSSGFSNLARFWAPQTSPVFADRPTVIRQIRRLARLETAVYSLDKVIEAERPTAGFPAC